MRDCDARSNRVNRASFPFRSNIEMLINYIDEYYRTRNMYIVRTLYIYIYISEEIEGLL